MSGHSPSLRQLRAATCLLPVWVDLLVVDMSCKWDHTTYGLPRLASLTWNNVFEVRAGGGVCRDFIPLSW